MLDPMNARGDTAAWLEALGRRELRPGTWTLEVIEELCRRLGSPQEAFPALHVAGSRGKGSTCALAESALRAAGIRTGLTTSPHLLSPCERIRVEGLPIPEERLLALVERVRGVGEDLSPGYFEVMTAAAFLEFAEAGVDVAVVEVGLGGRVDATKVVRPLVTAITHLGADHADRLGGTRESIAREKAGILVPGCRAVLAPNDADVSRVVVARAAEIGAPLRHVIEPDIARAPRASLNGAVQRRNAATAMVALEELALASNGRWQVPQAALARGFASTTWRARLELLPGALGRADLLLDVAHDADGTRALVSHVGTRRPRAIVFACLADKDVAAIARELSPLAPVRVLVPEIDSPRARPAAELAAFLRGARLEAEPAASVAAAIAEATRIADASPEERPLVVAFGSFHVASAILRALGDPG